MVIVPHRALLASRWLQQRGFRTMSVHKSTAGSGSMAKTKRIEFRVEPEKELSIRRAAALVDETLSSFLVTAALNRAEQVSAEASTTVVPGDFFDALHAALDEQPQPNEALARTARRSRRVRQT